MNYIDTKLDALYGERISVECIEQRPGVAELALLDLVENVIYDKRASVYLRPIQLRALAALCLITAEELDRAAAAPTPGGWGPK